MRKITALLMAMVLMLSALPALAEEIQVVDGTEEEEAIVELTPAEIALLGRPVSDEPTHITVGNTTKVSGYFFTNMWSNNTSDIDVRTLLHGYDTVAWDSQVQFVLDPMVVESLETGTSRRNAVYTIHLQQDLTYNDGTPITARDYVFAYLLCASKEAAELDAVSTQYAHIVGYEEYHSGESNVFSGIRLIDDYTYSVTVKSEHMPFFYDLAYIRCNPYPMSVFAPYCLVADDGRGVYLTSVNPEDEEVPFTTEFLREAIFNAETGYMSYPRLTSGPYMLTDYDRESGQVDFALNPYYKGNYEGVKPVIDTLTLVPVLPETMIDELETREVDLLNKCVDATVIIDGMGLTGQGFAMENYARIGYGFCAFACEKGPMQFLPVRQAVAYSFDQESFVMEYLESFGLSVYGYYGIGQWMTLAAMGSLRPEGITEAELAEWDAITLDELNRYTPNADTALQLLIDDGWTLNEQGETFDPERDTVRCKEVDGELMRLSILFAKMKDNDGANMVVEQLSQTLPALGFEFIVEEIPFTELLADYYREEGRRYDMNFMATNFASAFDPYYTFVTDTSIQGSINTSGIQDEELMELAWDMHTTEPMDFLTYEQRWLEFQKRFNEVLPTMPLYSNVYFDFHTDWLQNYHPEQYYSWPVAILYAFYAEPEEATEPQTADINLQVFGEQASGTNDSDDTVVFLD